MERIITPPSQSQSALSDQSSGLPSSHTFQEWIGSSITCKEDYPPRYLSIPPPPLHLSGLWHAIHPVPQISGFQIRNANYVLSRRGVVNKILKDLCLLRLSLPVPHGDYGIVEILVWPEMGELLNYGSDGEAVGMERIDREVIPECRAPWVLIGEVEIWASGTTYFPPWTCYL